MDFARKILGKYGWKEGDGLGKNSNGIAKPLRATLKFDNSGLGADQAASDFNNHWWERVFNDAADNVQVRQDGEESIKVDLKCENDGVEISTKSYSLKKLKKAKSKRSDTNRSVAENAYDNFLQAATLTNLGGEIENPDRIAVDDIEVTKVRVLTDEELFKACGGRTAHKGARHGLKLSGKLLRLEQQEQELLAKMLAKRNDVLGDKTTEIKASSAIETEDASEKQLENKKKKKKRKHLSEEDVVCESVPDGESEHKAIKKKKQKRNVENNSIHAEDCETVKKDDRLEIESESQKTEIRKKKKKHQDNQEVVESSKTKKKKAKTRDGAAENITLVMETVHKKKKKCKKKKERSDDDE